MVGLAENKATQPSLAGAWAELGNNLFLFFHGGYPRLGAQKGDKIKDLSCVLETKKQENNNNMIT